jgi:hypothetical protein
VTKRTKRNKEFKTYKKHYPMLKNTFLSPKEEGGSIRRFKIKARILNEVHRKK